MLRFFVSLSPDVKKNSLAVLLLTGAVLVLFWPLLFGNQILFFGDISLYFTPLLHFQQTELMEHGRLPLWNPTVLCGTPFVGNPQAWPLYPTSLLLSVFPAERVPGIIGAGQVLWAALGTHGFLRVRGRSRAASLLGALAWGMGGFLVSKMQFPNMIQAASWLPWLLLGTERVCLRPTAARSAVLGLAVGLALLAAHPQMFLLQFYVPLAWCVGRLGRHKANRRKRVVLLIVGLTLGIGLAAAQLFPTIELAQHSVRPDLPLAKANRFILPAYAVLTNFLAPNFYGNPSLPGNPYIAQGNFWEPCCYLGILPFAFFLYGAFVRFRDGETRFWLAVALVGIWLAVGKDAGLFRVAFAVLPGINRFHDAARFLFPATFAIVCGAAGGFDHLLSSLRGPRRRWVAAAVLLLTALDIGAFSRTLNPTMNAAEFREAILAAANPHPTASNGRLFQADEGRIWGAFISYRTYDMLSQQRDRQGFLQSLSPNLASFGGWRDAAGYEPVRLASLDKLLAPLKEAARTGKLKPTDPLLDSFAIEQIAHWDRISNKTRVRTRPQSARSARAQLWPNSQSAENAAEPLPLMVMDTSPDAIDITLPTLHRAGLVVLADTAYPGWSVRVDSRAAQGMLVKGAFRGVSVGKDVSRVQWRYEPSLWRLGLFISLLTVGIITAMCVPPMTADRLRWLFHATRRSRRE